MYRTACEIYAKVVNSIMSELFNDGFDAHSVTPSRAQNIKPDAVAEGQRIGPVCLNTADHRR